MLALLENASNQVLENQLCANKIENNDQFPHKNHFILLKLNFQKFYSLVKDLDDAENNFEIIKQNYKINFNQLPRTEFIQLKFEELLDRYKNLNQTSKRKWWDEDIPFLIWAIVKYSQLHFIEGFSLSERDWEVIADLIPYKSGEQCKYKFFSLEKMYLNKLPWTPEEDKILKELIMLNLLYIYNTFSREKGTMKWGQIAKELNNRINQNLFRQGKQCRERWNNYLNPNIKKGSWTPIEDLHLLECSQECGKKWSEIARKLHGRTENGVKNRFNSLIKKLKKHQKDEVENELLLQFFILQKLFKK